MFQRGCALAYRDFSVAGLRSLDKVSRTLTQVEVLLSVLTWSRFLQAKRRWRCELRDFGGLGGLRGFLGFRVQGGLRV